MLFSFLTSPTSLQNLVLSLLTSTGGIFFWVLCVFMLYLQLYYVFGRNLCVFFSTIGSSMILFEDVSHIYIYIYMLKFNWQVFALLLVKQLRIFFDNQMSMSVLECSAFTNVTGINTYLLSYIHLAKPGLTSYS